jgi:hypothetical protein
MYIIDENTPKEIITAIDALLKDINKIAKYIGLATHIQELRGEGLYFYVTSGGLYFSKWVKSSKEVGTILRKFIALGCRVVERPADMTKSPWNYGLAHPDFPIETVTAPIDIDFYFDASPSNECHMVQVGVKMVEQPIFKLVCPEGEAYHGSNDV